MGLSVTNDCFDLDAPEVDAFVSWLKRLYFSGSE